MAEEGREKYVPEQNSEKGIDAYESKISKTYSELGREGGGVERWGNVEYKGKQINLYTDKEFIHDVFVDRIEKFIEDNPDLKNNLNLVDFGGGDGFLLNEVASQLKKKGVQNLKATNLDLDPTGKNFRVMKEKIAKGEYLSTLSAVQGDFLQTPIKENSVDVGISRQALQYLSEEEQTAFFKNIHTSLKKDGILITEWPSAHAHKGKEFNEIWGKISNVITHGSSEFKRYFPPFGIFPARDIEKKTGLKLLLGARRTSWPVSPESFQDRFNIGDDELKEIQKIYQDNQSKYPELFTEVKGKSCLDMSIYDYHFQK